MHLESIEVLQNLWKRRAPARLCVRCLIKAYSASSIRIFHGGAQSGALVMSPRYIVLYAFVAITARLLSHARLRSLVTKPHEISGLMCRKRMC